MRTGTRRWQVDRPFIVLFASLVTLAWLALWLWAASPHGRYLDHGSWLDIGLVAQLCLVTPGGEILVPMLLYSSGWLLMSAAMMLPTILPLLMIWRRLVSRRQDWRLLLGLVIAGYIAAWGAFGVLAHALDSALHLVVQDSAWLTFNAWILGVAAMALAGLFQLSPIKNYCLERCRSPLGFAMQAWRGQHPRRQAWWLGLRHGAWCVACCWALMLLMFVVGMGSLGWMLLLAAVMAVEKNLPWGHRLRAPLGLALLAGALALAAANLGRFAVVFA